MDRLYEAVAERGHVCVGLDTAVDYIPPTERRKAASDAGAVLAFNKAIIDACAGYAACFKVQIACYEEMGLQGLETYAKTLKYLREKDIPVIADIKRGDIADTAHRYARAHFDGDFEADFVTLNPYMGMDSIEPWFAYTENRGKGAFVLVRTSNKGMKDFEYQELKTPVPYPHAVVGTRLYDAVAVKLAELAEARCGKYGYGAFGAVVGVDLKSGDGREETAELRKKLRNLFLLVPGYGAQGGAADDAALLLRNGNGGVVNASRSILKAWTTSGAVEIEKDLTEADNRFAANSARKAVIEMRDALRAAAGPTGT
ncbi:MAG: orotidine-5'-phosphate decarboxylase [Treponema sp.]|nr:orotidine-5'-phosphate decarboxylase [Treponema sp.]